jgi:hypothetical protein
VMVVRQVTFRLQGLASDEVRLGTSMELVEGVPAKPPVGIQKCSSCKVTQSPEWRKGPSGKKDLCNA